MRILLSLIVIIYLVGAGVELAPTFRSQWNTAPAPEFAASMAQELPTALAWPATVGRTLTGRD
jgi:hypothetical protein